MPRTWHGAWRRGGIFAGISSRRARVALRVSREVQNATIVTIVCDRGDRYSPRACFRLKSRRGRPNDAYLAFDIETVPDTPGCAAARHRPGPDATSPNSLPRAAPRTGTTFPCISTRGRHCCALRDEDSFRCWSLGSATRRGRARPQVFHASRNTPAAGVVNGGGSIFRLHYRSSSRVSAPRYWSRRRGPGLPLQQLHRRYTCGTWT